MRDGYYLSAYIQIGRLEHLMKLNGRHDQNLALWHKSGDHVQLVHYWELERVTGLKQHHHHFYDVEHARRVINRLLIPYGITLDDMVEVWGTPQLDTCDDYHSVHDYPDLSYHSVCHLFSTLLFDTGKFFHERILGLAVDAAPDNVSDPDYASKYFFVGGYVDKGGVELFPVSSPGPLWDWAKRYFKMREGTLMALGAASCSKAYLPPYEAASLIDSNRHDVVQELTSDVLARIERFTEADAGVLYNELDPRFTLRENQVSMMMKEIDKMSDAIMERNIEGILERFGIKPSETYLALAGGFALNCPTNSYLMQKYGFKGFIAPPCVSDTGQSLGIGLYAFYKKAGGFRFQMRHAYYGDKDTGLESILQSDTYAPFITSVTEMDERQVVEDLLRAPIVWFNDRAEVGPRALGNRSILADPRVAGNKDILNRVKQREWWRPVAPIILEEQVGEWFENAYPSPFMLQTFGIKEEKRDKIPVAAHLDGSARVQTLNRQDNPLLYSVIQAFQAATGVPVLCNTSLNDKGEPIINRIEEALNFGLRKGFRILYVNGRRIELQNHEQYPVKTVLSRPVTVELFSEEERAALLKQLNPLELDAHHLNVATNTKFDPPVDITSEHDVRRLRIAVRMLVNKYGLDFLLD